MWFHMVPVVFHMYRGYIINNIEELIERPPDLFKNQIWHRCCYKYTCVILTYMITDYADLIHAALVRGNMISGLPVVDSTVWKY